MYIWIWKKLILFWYKLFDLWTQVVLFWKCSWRESNPHPSNWTWTWIMRVYQFRHNCKRWKSTKAIISNALNKVNGNEKNQWKMWFLNNKKILKKMKIIVDNFTYIWYYIQVGFERKLLNKMLCGNAGIGRQAWLRIMCQQTWGFKSLFPH